MRLIKVLLQNRSGFLLLEVLIGIAVFAVITGGVTWALLSGQESTDEALDRQKAAYLTERALEGVRTIRDTSFAAISGLDPTIDYSISVDAQTGHWSLAPFDQNNPVQVDGFTTKVRFTPVTSQRIRVTATTSWHFGVKRAGEVTLFTELTDWNTPLTFGNWQAPITLEGSWSPGGVGDAAPTLQSRLVPTAHAQAQPNFQHVVVYDKIAYVSSLNAPGLYMFRLDRSPPERIFSNFTLPGGRVGGPLTITPDGRLLMVWYETANGYVSGQGDLRRSTIYDCSPIPLGVAAQWMQSAPDETNPMWCRLYYDFGGQNVVVTDMDVTVHPDGHEYVVLATQSGNGGSSNLLLDAGPTSSASSTASSSAPSSATSSVSTPPSSASSGGSASAQPQSATSSSTASVAPSPSPQPVVPLKDRGSLVTQVHQWLGVQTADACGVPIQDPVTGNFIIPPCGSASSASSASSTSNSSSSASSTSNSSSSCAQVMCGGQLCCGSQCVGNVCIPGDPCVGQGMRCSDAWPCCSSMQCPASGYCGVTVPNIWVLKYDPMMSEWNYQSDQQTLMSTLNYDGNINAISASGTGVVLATDTSVSEYVGIDISDPAHAAYVPQMGVDLPESIPALSVLLRNQKAFVGRALGGNAVVMDELVGMNLPQQSVIPASQTDIKGVDLNFGVRRLKQDPFGCYLFAGADRGTTIQIYSNQVPLIRGSAYTAPSYVHDLVYDPFLDRMIVITSDTLQVIRPGEGNDSCLNP